MPHSSGRVGKGDEGKERPSHCIRWKKRPYEQGGGEAVTGKRKNAGAQRGEGKTHPVGLGRVAELATARGRTGPREGKEECHPDDERLRN